MFESLKRHLRTRPEDYRNPIHKVLSGHKVAILATHGFEQSELFVPKAALEADGCEAIVVSLWTQRIESWKGSNWGRSIKVDLVVEEAFRTKLEWRVLPGGVLNPDKLRKD